MIDRNAAAIAGETHATRDTLRLAINGEPRTAPAGSVASLLAYLEIDPRTVVVELNRGIVRRPDLGTTELKDGDALELVHFVGGG